MLIPARRSTSLRRRAAFTLVEVLVSTMILVLVATMVTPAVFSRIKVAHGHALADELVALKDAANAFHTNTGVYPLYFTYLNDTTNAENSCSFLGSQPLTPTQKKLWRGPYFNRPLPISQTYYQFPGIDSIQTQYFRATSGAVTYLQIDAWGVDSAIAAVVEEAIDGPVVSGSYSSGNVKWTSSATNPLTYQFPIRGC